VGPYKAFYSVYFTDDNIGYAVGYIGIMMKTTNGGSTWSKLTEWNALILLTSVFFLNANKGYVVDERGDILKTINGGLTWTNDSSGTWNGLASVFFTDSTTGYVVG
jgi:hypothetical protein